MTSSHSPDKPHSLKKEELPTKDYNLSGAAIVFKKRSRPASSKLSKKRARTTSTPDDNDITEERRHFPSTGSAKTAEPIATGNRIQEQYNVTEKETSVPRNDATAQRLDVGGERTTPTSSTKPRKPFGPMRAPAHLRASVRVDYQPDVCKDYKETGYCGFGDACKFLHDRSDYKAGWQLDRDWTTQQRERRERMLRGEDPDAVDNASDIAARDVDDDGLPFACFICRSDFKQPVMTLCQHYFCEDCALRRIQKEGTCAICKKQLRGTLNAAPKLTAKLKLKHSNNDNLNDTTNADGSALT